MNTVRSKLILVQRVFALATLPLLLLAGLSQAQMESANYRLANGTYTGGGGYSSRNSTQVQGTVPVSGSRMSFADNWAAYTGLISISLGGGGEFLAYYSNRTIDTVNLMAQEFKLSYGGGDGTLSGQLFHRPGGARGYNVTPLIKSQGDTLAVTLPVDTLSLRGLEFYFRLIRGNDTIELAAADSPYVWITHFTNDQGRMPDLTRAESYRMVSLPIEIEGSPLVHDVFGDDLGENDPTVWRIGGYDTRQDSVFEYSLASPSYPGRAYWLITKERESFGAQGYSVRPELIHNGVPYYAVPCERGWNQIAVPFGFAVNFQDVLYERNGVIGIHDSTASVYWFAGAGYSSPSIMIPWSGYFFFTWETDLRLLFPYQEYQPPSSAKPAALTKPGDRPDWSIGVRVTSPKASSEQCYAVAVPTGSDLVDQFDRPMPPAAPGQLSVGFAMPNDNRYLWRIDARPLNDGQAEWLISLGTGQQRSLDLDQLNDLPIGYSLLVQFDMGAQALLSSDGSIPIPDDARAVRLLIGTDESIQSVAEQLLPDSYDLSQNFPNPFNPSTTIRFSLPRQSDVTLELFNLLGQRVARLLDRPMEAGVHDLVWSGENEQGRKVASGVYLYRLRAGSYQATRKMVLLK